MIRFMLHVFAVYMTDSNTLLCSQVIYDSSIVSTALRPGIIHAYTASLTTVFIVGVPAGVLFSPCPPGGSIELVI
jgi:hypothetical protein